MEDKILSILSGIRPEFDFMRSADFVEDGMLDSFDIAALVVELDETYAISIDGVDIVPENFANLGAIKNLLVKNGARP
jgi:acyl carrier protein